MMEFSGEFTVDGTPEELWKYFTDPDILADCAPGCESMTLDGPSRLTANLAVGVGSVKPAFDVEAIVTECDRPNRLEIQGQGEASRNSFEVVAWQELADNGDGTTTVTWGADAEVSGIIASMGERALGSVADTLVEEFFQSLEDHVNDGTPAESKLEAASAEDVEAAAERSPPEAKGGLAADALGTVATVTDAEGSDNVKSFLAGVACGVLGGSLVNRLRGRDRRQPAPRRQMAAEPGSQPPPGREPPRDNGGSLLALVLSAALGAAGALAWRETRADDHERPVADTEPSDTTEERRENGTDGHSPDPESDDPLDRLESRP